MENFNREKSALFVMEVDDQAKATFVEMARWTKFLSILGIVGVSLMLLFGVLAAMFLGSNSAFSSQLGAFGNFGAFGVILYFAIVAGLMFYPIWAMLKYSTGIKAAIKNNDKGKFNEAIGHLKGMFKYYGIFMIILLGLYGLAMVFGILAAAA